MTSSPIQTLYVMTDSTCVYAIDLLHEGVSGVNDIADALVARLGISRARGLAVIDGLVAAGFAERTGLDTVSDPGLARYCDLIEAAVGHIDALADAGDVDHAHDLVDAMDAAWNGRSVEPRLRWRAAFFHDSEAGRRHATRIADGSLGVLGNAATGHASICPAEKVGA